MKSHRSQSPVRMPSPSRWAGCILLACALGLLAALANSAGGPARAKAAPEGHADARSEAKRNSDGSAGPRGKPKAPDPFNVSGRAETTLQEIRLEDLQGHEVLRIGHLQAKVDVGGLQQSMIRMPSGKAEDLFVLLRKGKSGRTSISEAFHRGPPPSPKKARRQAHGGMRMQIGPLDAKRIDLRVEMGKMPVVLDIDHAQLRVERDEAKEAPRILLSEVHGRMSSPNPLPDDIDVFGGTGVVDLGADPLVDLRLRACVANAEVRLHVRVPERSPDVTRMTVDGDGFMGVTSQGVLGLVGAFKDSIEVDHAEVEVPGKPCDAQPSE